MKEIKQQLIATIILLLAGIASYGASSPNAFKLSEETNHVLILITGAVLLATPILLIIKNKKK